MKLFARISFGFFTFIFAFSGLFLTLSAPKAEAKLFDLKIAGTSKEFVSAAGSCIGQLLASLASGTSASKLQGAAGISVPVTDGGTTATTGNTTVKEACLDALAVSMSKIVLRKITESTINWINSGFEGDPLYVRDPESFFKGIANEQIGEIKLDVEGSGAPFVRSLLEGLIVANLTDFRAKIQYNLDTYLGEERANQYFLDFEAGGWDAWLLQTQYPQNNPIGASNLLGDELANKLRGTQKSVAENAQAEIDQGLGFLSLKECADPLDYERAPADGFVGPVYANPFQGMTPEEYSSLTQAEKNEIENAAIDAWTEQTAELHEQYNEKHTCKKWETRTPGTIIQDQLKTTLGSGIRQAELADELSKSIGLVVDALTNQLIGEGLESLSTDNSSTASVGNLSSYGNNTSSGSNIGTTTSWSSQGITGLYSIWDIDSLIQFQKDYLTALQQHTQYLQTTALPKLYELDFCVPGPRPNFEEEAKAVLEAKIESYGSIENRFYASSVIGEFLGLIAAPQSSMPDSSLSYKMPAMFRNVGNFVISLIKAQWFDRNALFGLPSINVTNITEYKKVETYRNDIESNDDERLETNAALQKLQYIKAQMAGLPSPASGLEPTPTQQDQIDQLQRILDQVSGFLAKENTIKSVNSELESAKIEVDIIGNQTKGLIKQCIDEVAVMTDQTKKLRFKYPETLLPLSVQNTYSPGPAIPLTTPLYMSPTYIYPAINYGDDSGCNTPDGYAILVNGDLELGGCYNSAVLEHNLDIY